MILTCSAEGLDSPEIDPHLKWYDEDNNEITDRSGRVYLESDGVQVLKLYFSSIENSDAGTYMCQGEIDGNRIEKSIKLNLFKDITFDEVPAEQFPRLYDDALIICKVSGQPTPTVSWRYRGTKIRPSNHYVLEQDGLKIMNITEADNGLYVCRAEVQSDARFDFKNINVVVHIPPKITDGPGEVEGIEGHEVSITCKATGKPSPKFLFYRDNNPEPIVHSERVQLDKDGGALNFRPLSKYDNGQYRCEAINDVGQDTMEGKLTVIVPAKVVELKNMTRPEGESETLTCIAEGNPTPHMVFHKVGSPIAFEEGDNDNGRINVRTPQPGSLEMTIDNLTPEDSSNYTCIATNSGGDWRQNGTILVEYKPRIHASANIKETYTWAGIARNISCHSVGEPEPRITWLRFGQVLETNKTNKIYELGRNSVLQVKVNEEDEGWIYGIYTCRSTNTMGFADWPIELKRARVPDKPQDVIVKESTPTLVVLTVTPPADDGGNRITRYQVAYDSHSEEFALNNMRTSTNKQQEIRIENLQPSTTYIFKVRARNEIGFGSALEHTYVTEAVRQPYPLILLSDPLGMYPHEYTIQWEKPRTGGIPIQEYQFKTRKVQVKEKDGSWTMEKPLEDWNVMRVEDDPEAPMLYYRLQGLKPTTFYQLEVTARNDIDWSLANAEFIFKSSTADGGLITGERIDGGATSLAGNAVVAMAAALLCIAFPAVQAML
ncbi:hypothetical protein NP493_50g02002 [Ridgeia piscesae]|uniref:Uncharacterized protein n=1 Tax=Ridgeia piscesae TaxID=27915 RepID=A0AAD9PBF2_RIDPI|nr:hypothetical protein NP493_50g02002 [Ridgeia piscesae]